MKKLKQLCSAMLCVVMVTVFTITPIRADGGTTTTISGSASITGTVAQFSEDKNAIASLSQTNPASKAILKATVKY